eukprot:TRINITY_DN4910_c0_g1_i1.p1 TRINITY_DN4910_c0_g1~~TRINITY_DN4910_c0_g1_i1.p1  ORF type:complete len:154 (+),score=33.76 TRINITY_DN4910_c0_g1_i1:49-510(+)
MDNKIYQEEEIQDLFEEVSDLKEKILVELNKKPYYSKAKQQSRNESLLTAGALTASTAYLLRRKKMRPFTKSFLALGVGVIAYLFAQQIRSAFTIQKYLSNDPSASNILDLNDSLHEKDAKYKELALKSFKNELLDRYFPSTKKTSTGSSEKP